MKKLALAGWLLSALLSPLFVTGCSSCGGPPPGGEGEGEGEGAGEGEGEGEGEGGEGEGEGEGDCDPSDPNGDADGDGLTNGDEQTGYTTFIDTLGFGLDATDLLTQRDVTSDPCLADTDGDGLSDADEFAAKTDPRDADTDGDGLSDNDELVRWHTVPISVDTDLDARGDAANPTAPNSRFFDGAELNLQPDPALGIDVPGPNATSPTLADTDGDGVLDSVELGNPVRSTVVADLPQLDVTLEDPVSLSLNVTYEDSNGQEVSFGTEISQTQSSSLSRSDSESTALSAGLSVTVGASVTAGVPPSATASVEATASVGIEQTTSTEVSQSTSQDVSQAQSQLETRNAQSTQLTDRGAIRVGVRAKNSGTIAYQLDNLAINVRQHLPAEHAYRSITQLTPANGVTNSFVLAPNADTGVITFEDTNLEPDFVKSFLRNPSSLLFEPVGFDLKNQDGTSFVFLTEDTFAQTALLVVDKGDGDPLRLRVATNVARDAAGNLIGVNLVRALTDAGVDFETAVDNNGHEVLVRVDDAQTEEHTGTAPDLGDPPYPAGLDPGPRTAKEFWVLLGAKGDGTSFDVNADFSDIALEHGDELRLVYVRDEDRDGVFDREEFGWGAHDDTIQSDADLITTNGDGLSDYFETRVGWDVTVTGQAPYHVFPNPTLIDSDGDGLDDRAEFDAGTDPQLRDTDGDGLQDDVDPDPLTFTNTPPVNNLSHTVTGGTVRLTGSIDDAENNVVQLTVDWGDGSPNTNVTSGFDAVDVSHTYASAGQRTITVVSQDSGGLQDSDTISVSPLAIPTDDAVLLAFDGNVNDTSGNGVAVSNNNGIGGDDFVTDRHGTGAHAVNLNNQGVPSLVSTPNLGLGSSFTVSVWVNIGNGFFGNTAPIAGTGDGFQLYSDASKIHFGKLVGASPDSGSKTSEAAATPAGTWAHYVGVLRNGTTVELWKDGALQETKTIAATSEGTTCRFNMGTSATNSCTGTSADDTANAFGASLDDLRVYRRALSQDEIAALFAE